MKFLLKGLFYFFNLNVNECFSFKTTFRFLILLQILEKTIKNIILYAKVLKIPILFNKIRLKDY